MRPASLSSIIQVMLMAAVATAGLSSAAAANESYPDFNRQYWEQEQVKARGKMLRGAVLGPTGLAVGAPTAVLAIKAADDPEQYLAYSIATGIAALGMTFHGFFSIVSGARGRDKAAYFVSGYPSDPPAVNPEEERDYYIRMQKKSAGKMVLFGLVLDVQAAVLLANGIVLSVRKSHDELGGDVVFWPSYLIGGFLLAGGTTLAILRARRYFALGDLGRQPAPSKSEVSFAPMLYVDPETDRPYAGLCGQLLF